MNTGTETQQSKKPNVGANSSHNGAGTESKTESKTSPRSSGEGRTSASQGVESKRSDESSETQRSTSSQQGEKRDAATASRKEGSESESEQDEPSIVASLDMALVNSSIAIGEWVKKIEALTPKKGGITRVSKFVVGKLTSVQNYLGDNSTKEIADTAWQYARKSPVPIGLAVVGAGVGWYIVKSNSSKAEKESEKPQAQLKAIASGN